MAHQPLAWVRADSINPLGRRLLTFETLAHRYIHPEVLTHRAFGRNASSSRATPSQALIDQVLNDPWEPCHWGANQSGMQANAELDDLKKYRAGQMWRGAAHQAALAAQALLDLGAHKQIVNRVLEPYLPIRNVMTGTEWGNWFGLRDHPDAQPEIRALAKAMWVAMKASKPVQRTLKTGLWHLPYVTDDERLELTVTEAKKVSAARCARVSYRLHDGKPTTLEADLALYERLMGGDPKHASPTEHQAQPVRGDTLCYAHGPFRGWTQFRKEIPGECIPTPLFYEMDIEV